MNLQNPEIEESYDKNNNNNNSISSGREKGKGRNGREGGSSRDQHNPLHIDPSDIQSNSRAIPSFELMGLKESLLRGMLAYSYNRPSAIQQRFILPVIEGKDVIAQASSGTGKTSAFCICLLQIVDEKIRETQALVLSPSRELALQSQALCASIGQFMGIKAHACVGGKSREIDSKFLDAGVPIVSGTPGRVLDMLKGRHLRAENIKILILDEADEMLGKGFKEQIFEIYRHLPDVQVVLVSATLPADVLEMSQKFMVNPIRILVNRDEISVDSIRQYFIDVDKDINKFDALKDLYEMMTAAKSVIFCNTRRRVDWLSIKMKNIGFNVIAMHGEMPQSERDEIMQNFRDGASNVLITTDVWARGIDVQNINLVIIYDLPINREQYIHRIGRTGRFGRPGVAISLIKTEELKILRDIEQFYSIRIEELSDEMIQ